jgi:uncharacterized repeat protein (TIGR03806 family)
MRALVALCTAVALAAACGGKVAPDFARDPTASPCARPSDYLTNPPQRLSALCVLENQNGTIVPAPGAVPYDLNTPLFSDYALKTRILWVPPGTSAQYDPTAAFDMPVGTIVTKTFAFARDYRDAAKDVRVVETRVLLRQQRGWVLLPYVWNEAQDDATLAPAGDTRKIDFIDVQGTPRTANYLLPAERDCHSCHDGGDGLVHPIGPSARQLNRDFAYAMGGENQLAHWTRLGILTGAPASDDAPRLAVWNDPSTGGVEKRARAYLDGNCAHCHNAEGLSEKTNLLLRWDEMDPAHVGVCKATGNAIAAGGFQYDILPGDPDHSVLPFRLASTDPHVMMPQIGRSVVHTEGLALVREWIAGMSGSCAPGESGTHDGGAADATVDGASDAGPGAVDAGPLGGRDSGPTPRDADVPDEGDQGEQGDHGEQADGGSGRCPPPPHPHQSCGKNAPYSFQSPAVASAEPSFLDENR